MKLNIGMFFGGLFGALGILIFLLAFGSDYWLLATEVKKCSSNQTDHEKEIVPITFHHEGFFWRCWFEGFRGENEKSMWNFWFTNQSPSKNCTHAYLSPFPIDRDRHNSSSTYESAVIYRGFWSIFMLLGVVTILAAGFLIICAAPFVHQTLYKVGGIFFITAGILFSLVVVMYVIWIQAMADLENYMNSHKKDCPHFAVYVHYGWSFILASIGIFFSLIAGMLFLLVGHTIQIHTS